MNSTERHLLHKQRSNKTVPRICIICDAEFQGKRNALTCSERCRKIKSRYSIPSPTIAPVTIPPVTRVKKIKEEKTWVYRAYNKAGNLLYVGITCTPKQRMIDHRKNSIWWDDKRDMTWEIFDTREAAERVEDTAIKQENPVFNIRGKP